MLNIYLEIFYTTCVALIGIIPVVIAFHVLFSYLSDLLFRR